MGAYDIPAMINKALQVSGQQKLFYIGISTYWFILTFLTGPLQGSFFFILYRYLYLLIHSYIFKWAITGLFFLYFVFSTVNSNLVY